MKNILTKNDLELLTNCENKTLTVIKFSAEWCRPCQVMKPIFEHLSEEYTNVNFCEINVDECDDEINIEYNVRSIPLFVFVKDGLIVGNVIGGVGYETLKNKIEEYI